MSTEIINNDNIKIKVYYLCNGNGSCNDSEVCGFGRISEFIKAFNLVLERFRVQYDTVTNTLMFTEKGE